MVLRLTSRATIIAANNRWQHWLRGSDNRKIFGALIIVGVFTLAAKLGSMAKDLMVAASFGTHDAVDAYLMAFIIPYFVMSVVSESFVTGLVPTYIEVHEREGSAAAHRLLSGAMLITIVVLCAMMLVLAISAPTLMSVLASGFDTDKLQLSLNLLYIMLPTIVISGVAKVWAAILNAGERFALASLSEIAVPLLAVLALVVGRGHWGIYALTVGVVIGTLVQVGMVGVGLKQQGVWAIPRWSGVSPAIRQVLRQSLPMVGAVFLMTCAPLVDQAMAATLGPGSVATLNFGSKVVFTMLGISTMALGTAVWPYFSRMVASEQWAGVRRTLRVYAVLILMVSLPVTLALVLVSEPLIRLLFERGAFTESDTRAVSQVQILFALQIPFYSLSILFVRLISAMKANSILLYGAAIGAVLNITMDYVLKDILGVEGIALATTIVYAVSLAFLGLMLYRLLQHKGRPCA